jgi:hypothetical protein
LTENSETLQTSTLATDERRVENTRVFVRLLVIEAEAKVAQAFSKGLEGEQLRRKNDELHDPTRSDRDDYYREFGGYPGQPRPKRTCHGGRSSTE